MATSPAQICKPYTFDLTEAQWAIIRAYSVLVWTQSMEIVILSFVVILVYFHGGYLWQHPIRLTCEPGY